MEAKEAVTESTTKTSATLLTKRQQSRKQARLNKKLCVAVSRGQLDDVESFVGLGANCNVGLLRAASNGRMDIAQFLIHNGATNSKLALVESERHGYVELSQLLVDNGVSVHNWLRIAAMNGRIGSVQLAIDSGASYFNQALNDAAKYGHIDIARLLVLKGAAVNCGLLSAAQNGHANIVEWSIDAGATYLGQALDLARRYNRGNIVQLLLIHRAIK